MLGLITMFCIMHLSNKVQSQEDKTNTLPYLEELRKALFPPDEPKISGKYHPDYIEEESSRGYKRWANLDTTIMVRAIQPDKDRVCNLLQKIAMTKNYAYFQPLMEMYERQQAYFEKEWIYLRFWRLTGCKAIDDPVIIMNGFEHALFTLELAHKNVSQSELIYTFDNYIRTWYEDRYLNTEKEKDKGSLDKEKKTIMYYHYDYLKKNRPTRHIMWTYNAGFGFYTFFMEELEDHLIKKVKALDSNNFDQRPTENFEAYFKSEEFQFIVRAMSNIQSRKFEQALESIFDELAKTGYLIRVFEYAQQNKEVSPQFIRFLLDKIYTHERFRDDLKVQKSFSGIMGYMLNRHTRPVIKQYLLERLDAKNNEDRLRTLSYLVYFSNDPDVLQLMIDKCKQKNLSPEESKILRHNFERMLKAPDFPEAEKNKVRESLKKLPHEKK